MIRTRDYYKREYFDKERSIAEIAKDHNTYPGKIRREILKWGFRLRNKSDAQAVALKTGRHKHPTKGSIRSKEVKYKISESMSKTWNESSTEKKEEKSLQGKLTWEQRSDNDKESFRKLGVESVRKAIQEGSKLEKFVRHGLLEHGYKVKFHADAVVRGTRVDLLLTDYAIVIDIFGPTHFLSIWGEENLRKTQINDNRKINKIIGYGFVFIKVEHLGNVIPQSSQNNLLKLILDHLNTIISSRPNKENSLITVRID